MTPEQKDQLAALYRNRAKYAKMLGEKLGSQSSKIANEAGVAIMTERCRQFENTIPGRPHQPKLRRKYRIN